MTDQRNERNEHDSEAAGQTGDDLLASARRVAAFCAGNAAAVDRDGGFPAQEFEMLARAGLLVAPLSPTLGGRDLRLSACGLQPVRLLRVLREIGRGSLPVGRLYEGHVNALELVQLYGTPAQIGRWAAETRAGLRFGVWAADDRDAPVRFAPDGTGGGVLHGAKNFCSGAGAIERAIVSAEQADGALVLLVVAMDAAAARVDHNWWQPFGMGPSVSGRVVFDGLHVRGEDLIGAPGDYLREPHFRGGAVRFAAVHQGGAEALFDAVRDYLRPQRDDPLVQARCAELAIAVRSGALWIEQAARAWQQTDDDETLAAFADLVRSALLELCTRALALAERALGASAFVAPQPFARLVRDLTMYLHQPAPDRALTTAGRYLLATAAPASDLWSFADDSRCAPAVCPSRDAAAG
jgi:alkylation response protein AidB-like acyl-CoA dehydrogenase